MEAAQTGYYNPAAPQNVYTPAQYPSAPPSYDAATKKNQWKELTKLSRKHRHPFYTLHTGKPVWSYTQSNFQWFMN